MTIHRTPPPQGSTPCSPEFSRQRVAAMLAKLWNHYPQEAKSPEAWKTLTEDFLAHLSPYPVVVIERAIERGQREWERRPTIAHMVEQCDRVLRDSPKPAPRGNHWSHTLGGYTADRRSVIVAEWLRNRRKLVEEATAGGWIDALRRAVEDGANILAQIEWHRRTQPGWNPAQRYCENLRHDAVRDEWEIFIGHETLTRWRGRVAA